ncbi:MAG: aminopeptidase [Limisphaerales bacterium]
MIDRDDGVTWIQWSVQKLASALVAFAVVGCQTAGYFKQAVQGQYQIMASQHPIKKLLAEPQTPPPLREELHRVEQLRQFARKELALPVDGHYLRYADLHRPYVVWNVYAAPEFSLSPKAWWYPIVGRLTYRGYFAEAGALRYAGQLRQSGFDVYLEGVEAYSTLGWFRDPVLNTFLHHHETGLAETLFHELAHQRLFVAGDTDFNEAFATAVAEEGVRRWIAAKADAGAKKRYQTELDHKDQVMRLVMACRQKLEVLYAKSSSAPTRRRTGDQLVSIAAERREKERIFGELRRDYSQLRAQWGGRSGYDRWFAQALNNAQLNSAATYYYLVPAFHRLLRGAGGDLRKFYRTVAALARLPQDERHRRLERLLDRPDPPPTG